MTPEALPFATVRELGPLLRQRTVTSRQLTELFLERLTRLGPTYRCVVTLTADLARQQADQADLDLAEGRDHGPLHGIPYGAKDLLATAGIPTTWGAGPLREQTFEHDATVIARLRSAGAVLVAKLAMVEIAGGFGYRQSNCTFTGPTGNGWNPARWAGGSSSGSGSAVAAGLVPFAIGSETSGSITTPAGYNGLCGLRPTYGRVSRAGAMALSWTLDKLGPMCRTADDCGLVLQAIAGPDPQDLTTLPDTFRLDPQLPTGRRPRIATLVGAADRVQPEVRNNYLQALDVVRQFADVEETELPDFPYHAVVGTLISCEMASIFEEFIADGRVWDLTAPEDRWGGHSSLLIPAVDYLRAQRIRTLIQRAMQQRLSKVDALMAPTVATVAGPLDVEFSQWAQGFANTSLGVASNAAGLPTITAPMGPGADGLPTSFQLVGQAGAENLLLALMGQYQSLTEWHQSHPDVP
jgi:aspartyl-tRNA(Asn)/glutamyl-tRNA(Gln) amidotransferase subunit A